VGERRRGGRKNGRQRQTFMNLDTRATSSSLGHQDPSNITLKKVFYSWITPHALPKQHERCPHPMCHQIFFIYLINIIYNNASEHP